MDPRDRERAFGKWYDRFDERLMVFIVTVATEEDDSSVSGFKEVEMHVPATYEVCGLCHGKGCHVNPSIDHNGITEDEMYELGPDFEEEYFGGTYDVPCYRCKGKRVEPVVQWGAIKAPLKSQVEEVIDSFEADVSERVSEMRMEAREWY